MHYTQLQPMFPAEGFEVTIAPSEPCWPGELGSLWMEWLVGLRVPVGISEDLKVQQLIDASWEFRPIEFIYFAGSEPGSRRRVTPTFVFTVSGFHGVYMMGICHKRKQLRTFRVDQMQML